MALQNAHANGFVAALGHASSNPAQEVLSTPSQAVSLSTPHASVGTVEFSPPAASTKARASGAKMGFLHAAYGLGAFSSPLIATQFAALPGHRQWASHYLVSLGIAVLDVILLILVFRGRAQDGKSL
jgi:MFS family permease